MLDSGLAQTVVERIMQKFRHNINIMNERGIIIASGDPRRIGDFHQAAYEVMDRRLEYIIVRHDKKDYIGAKPGVNMPITHDGEIIGALGISGDPEEVLPFADLVRMSAETMIDHAFFKEQVRHRHHKKDAFCNALLFEPLNINKLEHMAELLQYDITIPRVPIKIGVPWSKENEAVLEKIKRTHPQDMAMALGDNCIAIFKTIASNDASRYRQIIFKYIEGIRAILPQPENSIFLVSTVQRRLENYRQAFGYAAWMEDHIRPNPGSVCFFVDCVDQYYHGLVPFEVYDCIFSAYLDSIDKYGREIFIETANALYESSMNINEAAQALFVHRNTVILRIKKMKELLGLDPIHDIKDRHFFLRLAEYVADVDEKQSFKEMTRFPLRPSLSAVRQRR